MLAKLQQAEAMKQELIQYWLNKWKTKMTK
jgi:hypothetical protein